MDHETILATAADQYRAAQADLELTRQQLAAAVRAAAADRVRQADILRAIDHLWTREYLRLLVKDDTGRADA